MITCNENEAAQEMLARIETEGGVWWSYGNDGRMTVGDVDGACEKAGSGWRARFIDNPHGGDYGWGPLGSNEEEAVAFLLAERLGLIMAEEVA